jgi:hypothetical protein
MLIRAANDNFLAVYPTRIVSDKMSMSKVLFLFGHQI